MTNPVFRHGKALAMASCMALLVCTSSASAQRPKSEGDKVSVPALSKTITEGPQKTKAIEIYLREVLTDYKNEDAKLKKREEEFVAAQAAAKTTADKRKVQLDYLTERQQIITKMLEDFDDVNGRLQEQVKVLNGVIGDMKTQKGLAKKAAEASENTKQIVSTIEKLKRDNRELKAVPEAGTPEYIEWLKKKSALEVEFARSKTQLKVAVQSAFVYAEMAKGLEITGAQTAQWQAYVAKLSVIFEVNRTELAGEKDLNAQYIDYVKAGEVVEDTKRFAEFTKEFGQIVGRVTEGPMPDLQGFKVGEPPPLNFDFNLDDFDAAKFQQDMEKRLKGGK